MNIYVYAIFNLYSTRLSNTAFSFFIRQREAVKHAEVAGEYVVDYLFSVFNTRIIT